MAKLTLSFKDKKLRLFPITAAELLVGRDTDCGIHIDSLAIQPRHARIFEDNGAYHIESLQSQALVLVNQKPTTEPTALRDGDLIQVGKHTLSFSSEPASEGMQFSPAAVPAHPITGWLQIMSGSHLGRTIRLDRAMTRLGKTGKNSAMIVRREDGYYISHLEGDTPPRVNDASIGASSPRLNAGDCVRIGKLELHFYLDGVSADGTATPTDGITALAGQRRFTRIAFDAAAVLARDDRQWSCTVVDLSLKGALIGRPEAWDGTVGEDCTLVLVLGEDAQINMDVKVAHIEAEQVGLSCTDIDLDSITHLRRLVELNLGDAALLERELLVLG
ncbi:MAG: PilZ domain-containing protein [Thiohalobacteraceae bacterium]|nr:PilZ domain-containing protein [Gammaproteobacteria bacterium]